MAKRTPWVISGASQGLGESILRHMLHTQGYKPSDIIATSSSEKNRAKFEAQGVQFRVLDYSRPETIIAALQDVDNFFFVASPERDTAKRSQQHQNVIDSAKAAKVGRVWYNSLAFGGFGDDSKIGFQQAHYHTENLLRDSGLDFVNVRAGVYADAFPLFLNWYPSTTEVLLPTMQPPVSQSKTAYTSREELGEAHAALFAKGLEAFPQIKPKGDKNLILLTSQKTDSLVDLVSVINKAQGSNMPIKYLEPQEWIDACTTDDVGHKPRGWFEARLVYTQGVCNGDGAHIDPAMGILLGRKPESGDETVTKLVKEGQAKGGYTWHQNHAS